MAVTPAQFPEPAWLARQTEPDLPWLTVRTLMTDYLFGLPLASTEFGIQMDPNTIARYIRRAVATFERELKTKLSVVKIRTNAERRGLTKPTDYDVDEDAADWHPDDFSDGAITVKLRRFVKRLIKVELHVPNGQQVMEYPQEWLHLTKKRGFLRIFPYGTVPTNVMPYAGYPLISGMWGRNLPGALWVDYDAGLDMTDPENQDIADNVARFAAIMALDVSGDAFLPGLSSYSIGLDGLSESLSQTSSPSFAAFGARRKIYADEITEWWKRTKDDLNGPIWTVV